MTASRPPLPVRLVLEAYAGGPLPEWEELAESSQELSLRPGEQLFRAGDADVGVFILWRGLLKAAQPISGRHDQTLYFVEENQVVASASAMFADGLTQVLQSGMDPRASELAATINGRALATLTALEPSDLVVLSSPILWRLINQHRLWADLVRTLLITEVIALGGDCVRARSMSAEENYAFFARHRPSLVARLTQREIANYLGVSEAGLSRIIKRVTGREDGDG